jgi:hypothetical protein
MPHCEKGVLASLEEGRKPMKAGELTAVVYKECVEYTVRNGRSWSVYCVVMGSLVGCLLEFYRRKVAKYEDEKMAENGEYMGGLG